MYKELKSFKITPSVIREYKYCPIIPWINKYFNTYEPLTYSMENSTVDDKSISKILENIDISGEVIREKPVILYGDIYGFIDLLVRDKSSLTAIEIKKYSNKYRDHQIIQLKTYAYMYNRSKLYVKRIILIQNNEKVYDKVYELEDHVEVKQFVENIEKTLNSEKPPEVKISNKCNSCWYRRLCPALLTTI